MTENVMMNIDHTCIFTFHFLLGDYMRRQLDCFIFVSNTQRK